MTSCVSDGSRGCGVRIGAKAAAGTLFIYGPPRRRGHSSGMHPVVEGNFCKHGHGVVMDLVKRDVLSVALFGGPIDAVCTQAVHTDACRAQFHHRRVTVPAADVAAFVDAHLARLQRRPRLLAEARSLLVQGGPSRFPAVAPMQGRLPYARKVFGAVLERWAKQTLPAATLLPIASALSRATLATSAERCLGDEAAVKACRDYAAWLLRAPVAGPCHRGSPLHEVAATAAAAVCALPTELVLAILARALSPEIANAWLARQNHGALCGV